MKVNLTFNVIDIRYTFWTISIKVFIFVYVIDKVIVYYYIVESIAVKKLQK